MDIKFSLNVKISNIVQNQNKALGLYALFYEYFNSHYLCISKYKSDK